MNHSLSRRAVLGAGTALFSTPLLRATRMEDSADGGSLIVLQLSGGNDGLSTIIPWADPDYQKARRVTKRSGTEVLSIDAYRGFHPALKNLHKIYGQGKLAVIEGCGYPDQIRSHFKALDIWHSASPLGRSAGNGWIGNLSGHMQGKQASPEFVVHVGSGKPYAIHSNSHPACSVQSPTAYRWFGADGGLGQVADGICKEGMPPADPRHKGRDAALAQLRGVLADAKASSLRVRAAAATHETAIAFPRTGIGAQLRDVSAIVQGGVGTRIASSVMGGFDTHAGQLGKHDRLMADLDAALGALYFDLGGSPGGRKATILIFSEFGRRVSENGSGGTDHGKAGPMFVLGHGVKGGLFGKHPSLANLNNGDLKYTTDFRSVYASLIEQCLGVDPQAILGAKYPLLRLLG